EGGAARVQTRRPPLADPAWPLRVQGAQARLPAVRDPRLVPLQGQDTGVSSDLFRVREKLVASVPLTPTLFLAPQSRAIRGPSPRPNWEREKNQSKRRASCPPFSVPGSNSIAINDASGRRQERRSDRGMPRHWPQVRKHPPHGTSGYVGRDSSRPTPRQAAGGMNPDLPAVRFRRPLRRTRRSRWSSRSARAAAAA